MKTPWYVMNRLLSLQYWIPEVSPLELVFDINPFWIQVHNLPLEYLNSKNVSTILKNVGTVMEIEKPLVNGRVIRLLL